jgi:hypothetical protein
MKTWYCFEIYTDGSVHMGAFEYNSEMLEIFVRTYDGLGEYAQGSKTGTTQAEVWEKALDAIRMGDWDE